MKKPKKKTTGWGYLLTLLPIYLFTVIFVLGPLVYMLILSFLKRAESWGVVWEFSLQNYADMFDPVYLHTFKESIKLAFISTILVGLIGYPCGYFMAKLSPKWQKLSMMFLMIPFWTSSLIRLYGWITIFSANGTLDKALMT